MNLNTNEQLKDIYKSSIKASYFAGFKNNNSIQKSKLQAETIDKQDKNIDDKTFRIAKSFNRPTDFTVSRHSGKCYLEPESLFACFSKRKIYEIILINAKLAIKSGDKIARFVDFDVINANAESKGNSFVLKFPYSKSFIEIEPASSNKEEESLKWVKTINDIIEVRQAKKHSFSYLQSRLPDFYRTEQILNSQFVKKANSGDIILFKSPHSAASIQRLFTDSEYDHVAIVLRNMKNQIFLYESSSDTGVGFTPWKSMIRYEWYTETDKIVWKPLNIKLTPKDIEIIQAFVIKTLGKQFQLNLDKLLQFKSTLQRSAQQEEKKTYFCSELIARLYKQLGILNEEKSSTNYYPVDFSDKGSLRIIREGVSFENQKIISFDKVPNEPSY